MYHLYFSDNPDICFVSKQSAGEMCDKVIKFSSEKKALDCALKNDDNYLDGYMYYVCWYKDRIVFES